MSCADEKLLALLNGSGFLLQIRIAQHVEALRNSHWTVAATEHPWLDPATEADRFIDLVLLRANTTRFVVECKRPRGGEWLFLIPNSASGIDSPATLCWTHKQRDQPNLSGWAKWRFTPKAPHAEYCIVRGTGEQDRPLLETLASSVLRSVEYLADQELHFGTASEVGRHALYVPVILTTARIMIARVDTETVDLSSGEIPNASFEEVPFVFFTKTMRTGTDVVKFGAESLQDINRKRMATVLIGSAGHLDTLLNEFELKPYDNIESCPWIAPRREAWIHRELNAKRSTPG